MKKINETHKFGINKIAAGACLLLLGLLCYQQPSVASPVEEVAQAQQTAGKKVTLKMEDKSLVAILTEIKKQTGLSYGFRNTRDASQNDRYSINVSNVGVEDALKTLLKNSKFTYQISGSLILITPKAEPLVPTAEQTPNQLKGRVVDQKGAPIIGASIVVAGTNKGSVADVNGRFSIVARPDDVLKISCVGYKTETALVGENKNLNIRLESTTETLEEVTVVAFGEQKKESVVSAITTVRPMDLKTSNSDLTTSFAGKIAGIVGWQTGGIPGALTDAEMNTKFYIRGITSFQTNANIDPLILIDGVESSKVDLSRLAPEDIEAFSVLKDASATAMYGARGANGVILITTKKGTEGSVYTTVRYEAITSSPTQEIDVVDPVTYMKMYNKALLSRDPLATPMYDVERIKRTNNPNYPSFVYPANDWKSILFKEHTVNHHFGVNIRGGSKIVQYYASLNYNHDSGLIKTDRLNQFDCNITNNGTNFRVNLNIDLHAGIKLLVNSSGNLDNYHGPLHDVRQAYGLAFHASPVDFAPIYEKGDVNSDWKHLRFGGKGMAKINPYQLIQGGYMERSRYSAMNKVEYIQNLSTLVNGLELRASAAISNTGYFLTPYVTTPFKYELTSYDDQTGDFTLLLLNPTEANRTLSVGGQAQSVATAMQTYEAKLMHNAAWGNHQTSLTGVFNAQESTKTPPGGVLNGLPHRNLSLSMRGSYGYKDRYFAEASFGYNGSERFADKNKWGFFPAGGLAWVVSKERFMESVEKWLPMLKLRASYGRIGNDGIIANPRFVYLTEITEKNVFDVRPNNASLNARYTIVTYGDEDIKWEISEQVNFGLEAKMFKGVFEFTLDAYQEVRHNILSYRTVIPSTMGLEQLQLDNIGQARSRGLDFSGKIQHSFSQDLWVIFNGTVTYNKVIYQKIEEAVGKPSYQLKVGHELKQDVGYIAEGLFKDWAEIANAPVQGGDVMPGDIRYRDINGDGKINELDAVHIGFPTVPRLTYGFSGMVNYKGIELSCSFQGSGQRTFFIDPSTISPFVGDNAMLTAIYESHWSEDNMSSRPFWPRLSTKNIIDHNPQENWANNKETRKSTYFMRECSFLRCTAIELGYTLPRQLRQKLRMQNIKVYARANNPFMVSNFDLWDVELGSEGFNYPIQKTYSLGVNFSF